MIEQQEEIQISEEKLSEEELELLVGGKGFIKDVVKDSLKVGGGLILGLLGWRVVSKNK